MYCLRPRIWEEFACIADRCTYSCCIEWTIGLDEETARKYKEKGITINERKDMCVMPISDDKRCSQLDECGLCNIVSKYGEDMLSYTCAMYPRSAGTDGELQEQYLFNSCPAVLKLLMDETTPMSFVYDDATYPNLLASVRVKGCERYREVMIDIMQKKQIPLGIRMYEVYSLAEKIAAGREEKEKLYEKYENDEYLKAMAKGLMSVAINFKGQLDYKMFLHRNIAGRLRGTAGIEKYYETTKHLLNNIDYEFMEEKYNEFTSYISRYDSFFENYTVNSLFRLLAIEKEEYIVRAVLTIILTTEVIRFNLFLLWLQDEINDELVCTVSAYYSRYLEHSFDNMQPIIQELKKNDALDEGYILIMLR